MLFDDDEDDVDPTEWTPEIVLYLLLMILFALLVPLHC
jgi:hypothetical protein